MAEIVAFAKAGAAVLGGFFGVSTATVYYTSAAIATAFTSYKIAEEKLRRAERKARLAAKNRSLEIQSLQVGSNAPRRFIYGEMLVNGHLVYQETTGTDSKNLDRVVYLGEGPINSVTGMYLNDILVAPSTAFDSSVGSATSTSPYDSGSFRAQVGLDGNAHLTTTNSLIADIKTGSWDTNCRMEGNAWLAYRLVHNNEIWTTGVPNVRVKVKGRKLYDPRLDGTRGGSGSHRYNDDTTWAWSDNPALCILDFIINGMEADIDSMDLASFRDSADVCDQNVSILDSSGSSTTEKRYRTNGVAFLDTEVISVVEELLASCHGTLVEEGGSLRLLVPDDSTSSVSAAIDEDDIISELNINVNADVGRRINQVSGTFTSSNDLYQEKSFGKVQSSSLISDDGRNHLQQIDLPFVTSESQAQRLASIILLENSLTNAMTITLKPEFAYLRVGDVITISFDPQAAGGGASSAIISTSTKWQIQTLNISAEGSVSVTCQEYADSSYTWSTSDHDYLTRTALADSFFDVVPTPTIGAINQFNRIDENGIENFGVQVTITHPSHPQLVRTEVQLTSDVGSGVFREIRRARLDITDTVAVFDGLTKKRPDGTDGSFKLMAQSFTTKGVGSSQTNSSSSQNTTLTNAIGPDTSAPSGIAHSAISATAAEDIGSFSITVGWTNASDTDIHGAYVHIQTSATAPTGTARRTSAQAFIQGTPGDVQSFTKTGFAASTTFRVFIFMVDRVGNISAAPTGTVTTVTTSALTSVDNSLNTANSVGAIPTSGAAADINNNATTVSGGKITNSSIQTDAVANNAITAQFQLNNSSSTPFLGFPNGRDMDGTAGRGFDVRTKIETAGARVNDRVVIQRHLGTINLGQTLSADTDYTFFIEQDMKIGINRRLIATSVDSPHLINSAMPEAELIIRLVCGNTTATTATAAASGDASDNLFWDWIADADKFAFTSAGKGITGMLVHAGIALDNRPAVAQNEASNIVIAKATTTAEIEFLFSATATTIFANRSSSSGSNTNPSTLGSSTVTIEIDPVSGNNADLTFPMNAPANSNWPDQGYGAIIKRGSFSFSYTSSTTGSTVSRTYRDPYWLFSYTKDSTYPYLIAVDILDAGDQNTTAAANSFDMVPTLLYGISEDTLNTALAQEIVDGCSVSTIPAALRHIQVDDDIVYIPKVAFSKTHPEIFDFGRWDHKFFGGSSEGPLQKQGILTVPSGESKVEVILEMLAKGGNLSSGNFDDTTSANWFYNGTHDYYGGTPVAHKHWDDTAENAASLPKGRTGQYLEPGPLYGVFGNTKIGLTEFKR